MGVSPRYEKASDDEEDDDDENTKMIALQVGSKKHHDKPFKP